MALSRKHMSLVGFLPGGGLWEITVSFLPLSLIKWKKTAAVMVPPTTQFRTVPINIMVPHPSLPLSPLPSLPFPEMTGNSVWVMWHLNTQGFSVSMLHSVPPPLLPPFLWCACHSLLFHPFLKGGCCYCSISPWLPAPASLVAVVSSVAYKRTLMYSFFLCLQLTHFVFLTL